jgi:hypothetical protein
MSDRTDTNHYGNISLRVWLIFSSWSGSKKVWLQWAAQAG